MFFAYPNALFPFLAAKLDAPWATRLMFAAPSVGAFGVTVFSGWMSGSGGTAWPSRFGPRWGLMITGWPPPDLYVALACLIAAGRRHGERIFPTLWTTIPDALRGRWPAVELLQLRPRAAGCQLRSGAVASLLGTRFSLVSGDWPASVPSHWHAAAARVRSV